MHELLATSLTACGIFLGAYILLYGVIRWVLRVRRTREEDLTDKIDPKKFAFRWAAYTAFMALYFALMNYFHHVIED